jgi:hypothetical protein
MSNRALFVGRRLGRLQIASTAAEYPAAMFAMNVRQSASLTGKKSTV